jgi:hypothetical protein
MGTSNRRSPSSKALGCVAGRQAAMRGQQPLHLASTGAAAGPNTTQLWFQLNTVAGGKPAAGAAVAHKHTFTHYVSCQMPVP